MSIYVVGSLLTLFLTEQRSSYVKVFLLILYKKWQCLMLYYSVPPSFADPAVPKNLRMELVDKPVSLSAGGDKTPHCLRNYSLKPSLSAH